MSKHTNRPMSEYENAISSVLNLLVIELASGPNWSSFLAQLRDIKADFEFDGATNAAATIGLLVLKLERGLVRDNQPHG